jgi:methanogenic corrinoid protein MtbC1
MLKDAYFKITDNIDKFAELALEYQFIKSPGLKERLSSEQIKLSLEDTKHHLNYLSEAIAYNDLNIFKNYAKWVKHLFENRKIPLVWFTESLLAIDHILKEEVNLKITNEYIEAALDFIDNKEQVQTYIDTSTEIGKYARKYTDFLLEADKNSASKLIDEMVDKGFSVEDIYLKVFAMSQYEIGLLWHKNEISVAEEHYCTAATQMIMSQLYPIIFSTKKENKKIIVTCTKNELHEIGARMVADILELYGWQTYYIGAQSHYQSVIKSIEEYKPNIIAISATISYHLSEVEELIKLIRKKEEFNSIKIIVGGRPFNENTNLYKVLGADGYAKDAQDAVKLCEELINNA